MHQPFTINRNLLTCIKSTFSLISPGFRFIRFSLKKHFENWQTILLESRKGGVVAGKTNLDKIFIIRENSSPFLSHYPETRRTLCSAIEPQTAALCDECWQALIGGDWWSFWPGPITARHSQDRAALGSPQNHWSRPWWLHSEGPRVLHVPVQGAAQRPLWYLYWPCLYLHRAAVRTSH